MDLLHRIRFITRNYKDLQGLVLVPVGIGFISISIFGLWLDSVVFPEGMGLAGNILLFFFSFFIVGTMIGVALGPMFKYYHHTFGQVNLSGQPRSGERHIPTDASSGWVITGVVLFVSGMWLDVHLHPSLSLLGLALATILVMRWYQWEHRPTHYLVVAVIITLLSVLPAFNATMYSQLFLHGDNQYGYIVWGTIGLILLVIGPFDHLLLLHNLKLVRDSVVDENG